MQKIDSKNFNFPNQLAIAQSISGTGALRIGAEFLNAWFPHAKNVIVPNPTWGNHIPIMKNAGLSLEKYTYFDKQTNGLNIDGMLEDLHVSMKFYMENPWVEQNY